MDISALENNGGARGRGRRREKMIARRPGGRRGPRVSRQSIIFVPDLTSGHCDFAEPDNAFVFVRLRSYGTVVETARERGGRGGDIGPDEITMKTLVLLSF